MHTASSVPLEYAAYHAQRYVSIYSAIYYLLPGRRALHTYTEVHAATRTMNILLSVCNENNILNFKGRNCSSSYFVNLLHIHAPSYVPLSKCRVLSRNVLRIISINSMSPMSQCVASPVWLPRSRRTNPKQSMDIYSIGINLRVVLWYTIIEQGCIQSGACHSTETRLVINELGEQQKTRLNRGRWPSRKWTARTWKNLYVVLVPCVEAFSFKWAVKCGFNYNTSRRQQRITATQYHTLTAGCNQTCYFSSDSTPSTTSTTTVLLFSLLLCCTHCIYCK